MNNLEQVKTKDQAKPKAKQIEIITLVTTASTLILMLCAIFQLQRYTNSMKADFAHKIKTDFFNEKERTIMFLLNNDMLQFTSIKDCNSNTSFSYFQVDKKKLMYFQNYSLDILKNTQSNYSSLEIEDIILNHFEDLNIYRINNIVGDDYLYNGFYAYVESVYKNTQIQKLITWLNTESGNKDSYSGFQDLYKFLNQYDNNQSKEMNFNFLSIFQRCDSILSQINVFKK